ncbi:MAG: NFACT RNA binding domain-containing protein, partial [Spirochaetaceae bacterium]|nr:NFACT RNA binding domain-containing protein [Spirochaetaceae bacterium]
QAEYSGADRYRQIGDILIAMPQPEALPCQPAGGKSIIESFDFYRNEKIFITIDPTASMVENAQRYYEKYRKATSGLDNIMNELKKIDAEKQKLELWFQSIRDEQDPFAMAKALERAGTVRDKPLRRYNCLSLEDKGWTILIGRTGKENDELLRHEVRGSDLWLHARDYAGSYVFIKAQKQKTFPLDIMMDAARLAIYYSKARKNLRGNVYYTFVKYLRRAKDGPKGLVIPTLEKNLFVDFDENEIRDFLDQTSGGDQ